MRAPVVVLCALSCARQVPGSDTVLRVDSEASAARAVGRMVEVRGVAVRAKLSAAVQAGDLVLYCLDRPSWERALDGRVVVVRGRLEQRSEFQARRGPGGEVSQGTEGPVWAMEHCEVQLADP